MTTTAFAPNTTSVFSFQATLDGALYTVTVPWNIARQGWYVNVRDQSDSLVVANPLVGSAPVPAKGINLVGGYFTTSTMYYYPASGVFVVAP